MPRKYAKSTKKFSRTKRTYKRYNRYNRNSYRILSKRISAVSKRVAGEVCKWESTPNMFGNSLVVVGTSSTPQSPLNTITSGQPYIYPINWIYQQVAGNATQSVYIDGIQRQNGETITASFKNPLWYNTANIDRDTTSGLDPTDLFSDVSPGLQYRLKYIYINALFNASVSQSINNTDGALRIVIVKDKQPTGGAATWSDETGENSRGVFNSNRINAQLNPNTVGRFKIMYDKTLRFNTTNGYKPFKYFKRLSTVVRNNRDTLPTNNIVNTSVAYNNFNSSFNSHVQSSKESPPIQKNAFYLMIFSDGLTFSYSTDSSTPAASFNLFNRVAYYNN